MVFLRRLLSSVRRRPRPDDGAAAERVLQAERERAAVQERMTRVHPDGVLYWMRPR